MHRYQSTLFQASCSPLHLSVEHSPVHEGCHVLDGVLQQQGDAEVSESLLGVCGAQQARSVVEGRVVIGVKVHGGREVLEGLNVATLQVGAVRKKRSIQTVLKCPIKICPDKAKYWEIEIEMTVCG